ncbi:MAG TPA: hypothetical protein DGG95_06485, partial [Cytophagales bacterium]|nr:hypothetical protein [Cytophagales bacterium]
MGPDSTVWASLIGKGLSRYSKTRDAFLPLHFEGIAETWLASVIDVGCDKGLFYLLGSDGKLICTLNNNIVFTKRLIARGQFLFHQFVHLGHDYYMTLATDDGRLLLYNLSDIERAPTTLSLGNAGVSSVNESLDHSSLWIGSEAGSILKVSAVEKHFELHEMNSYFPAFSKSGIKILTITETLQNLIWVGTDGDGVYKFLTRPRMFYSISKGEPEASLLSHSIVRSIYEDPSGKLYVGTRGGGLNIIDRSQGKTKVINTKNGLSNNAVLALTMDQTGNLWIGLDGEGMDMLETKTGRILHFPRDFENHVDLNFSSVYALCVDAFGDLWLGTSGYGVIHFKVSKKGTRYHLVDYDQVNHSTTRDPIAIRSNIVYSIIEEKPNILWFGTRGSGIYRYNALTKKIEDQIQADSQQKLRLVNNDVLSLYMDQQEQLWVGTSGGLTRIFMQSKPFRASQYTLREGLYNNSIHGILEDEKNNIWISTNHGLTLFNRNQNTFKNFDSNDGLENNEFADGASFRSRHSEKLFFGGIDGLDIVHPSKNSSLNYFPRLAVKEFLIHNVGVTPASGILENTIDLTTDLSLSYDQNFISFSFTTLDYWSKQKSEYAYFLENFDKDWNYIGQQQSLTLTNIPPGHYKLNINSTNENGEWNSKPRVFTIIIAPPFWKTTWAYLLYALLGIGLQVGIVLYIRERARAKRALAMDRFKAQQQKELNDYKLQFFTNVAHEFRTPLTLILGPVSSLLNKITDPDSKNQLKTIHNNSIRLQKLIEELIQFRKIESGKDKLELAYTDLIPFTQQIVESFQGYATERDIHLEFHPEPEALSALIDFKKLEKILLNLISNSIKYSSKGGIVTVTLKNNQQTALFQIRDEGIGIAEENKDKIFESFYHNPSEQMDGHGLAKSTGIGLSLTKSLVMIHRGEIRVESKLGKGSTFTVRLPITKDSYSDIPEEKSMVAPV